MSWSQQGSEPDDSAAKDGSRKCEKTQMISADTVDDLVRDWKMDGRDSTKGHLLWTS